MVKSIPFSKKNILDKDLKLVNKILKSGWLTHGKYTEQFENKFSQFTKSKYAVTVSSCTAGLHLICLAIGLKAGDEVLVPNLTHTATAHSATYTGAKVKFVDINLYDGNLCVKDMLKKINAKTKAIIAVHLTGISVEIDKILKICKKKNIILIEDCAHALGTSFKSKHVGNFGIAGSFSFYPTKQLTTGEGGMVVTNNKSIFKKIKMLKAFGIDKDIKERKIPGLYDVKGLGFNYRMTDFQSALGLEQLKRYKKELSIRKQNAILYCRYLKNIKNIKFNEYIDSCSYFIFPIFLKKKYRDRLIKIFKKKKVGFSVHYAKIIDEMTYYKKNHSQNRNSRIYASENISLPVHSGINKNNIVYISKLIKKALNEN
tara:strand:+ start:794 stop:1909 length:1116 start_codon:yes stop_codon:yes gene_type:complete